MTVGFDDYAHLVPKIVDTLLRTSYPMMNRHREDLVQEGYLKLHEFLSDPSHSISASFATIIWIAIRNHLIRTITDLHKQDTAYYIGAEDDLTEVFADNYELSVEKKGELVDFLEGLSPDHKVILEDALTSRRVTYETAKAIGRRVAYVVAVRRVMRNKLRTIINGNK